MALCLVPEETKDVTSSHLHSTTFKERY